MPPRVFSKLVFLVVFACAGCSLVKHSQKDQRVIVLPANDPGATLDAAKTICQGLSSSLGTELHKRFPGLTEEQLKGVFLTWNEGNFSQGGHQVFILTGISYQAPMPDAKSVADLCETMAQRAVAAKFPSYSPKHPGTP